MEGGAWPLPTLWCGCISPESHEETPPPVPQSHWVEAPSVTAQFDQEIVFFESTYTNTPTEIIPKQSTHATLTLTCSGGPHGAYLSVEKHCVDEKLQLLDGLPLPVTRIFIPANCEMRWENLYEGREASVVENDITVRATLHAINEMSPPTVCAHLTSVQLALEAVSHFPTNRAHHIFGPAEKTTVRFAPSALTSEGCIEVPSTFLGTVNDLDIRVPNDVSSSRLVVRCKNQTRNLPLKVIRPTQAHVIGVRSYTHQDWLRELGSFPPNCFVGVGAFIDVQIYPLTVSFQNICILERTTPATNIWGCCTNQMLFPLESIGHGQEEGGVELPHVNGAQISEGNLASSDNIAFWVLGLNIPCEGGGWTINIPWQWYTGIEPVHDWMIVPQKMTILPNGTAILQKHNVTIQRTQEGVFSCPQD